MDELLAEKLATYPKALRAYGQWEKVMVMLATMGTEVGSAPADPLVASALHDLGEIAELAGLAFGKAANELLDEGFAHGMELGPFIDSLIDKCHLTWAQAFGQEGESSNKR